eukprot:scaffold3827_cov179-Cylindrotheca_fusiformis.AAC.44
MTGNWIAPSSPAPPQVQDPLVQLNSYLESLDVAASNDKDMQQNEILNVAEFLYGSNTLSASLALLDDASAGNPVITKVSTPVVRRSLYLVKGSSKTTGGSQQSYLCFAGQDNTIDYCSCRSFLEKITTKKQSQSMNAPLCKHLLALKLMPYLSPSAASEITTTSHDDFAKFVLDRTSTKTMR